MAVDKKRKNPFAFVAARVVQLQRKAGGASHKEIAVALGLNESTYRRIEAGIDTLQPAHALQLVQHVPALDWRRLSLFLVLGQAYSRSNLPPEAFSARVRSVDPAMADMVMVIEPLLLAVRAREKSERVRAIADDCASKMATLFRTEASSRVSRGETPIDNLLRYSAEGTSPLHFDMVFDLLRRLGMFPPQVTPSALMAWEIMNASRFRRVFAVVTDPMRLPESVDQEGFDWSYIWRKGFDGVFVCALADASVTNRAESRFLDLLKAKYEKDSSGGVGIEDKIKIRSVPNSSAWRKHFESVLNGRSQTGRLSSNTTEGFCNAWLYLMGDTLVPVGYLDDTSGTLSTSIRTAVLDWQEVVSLLDTLERFWFESDAVVPVMTALTKAQ